MINLEEYSLDTIPDYCLYSKSFASVLSHPKVGIIYIAPNTKFGYWFELYHKNLSKRAEWLRYKPMQALCCRYVSSRQLNAHFKQQRKIQGLKDGKGYKDFLKWMRKELEYGYNTIWFISYRYLEQFYDDTLWSSSKNIL